ncbi:MAG TPA: glutamyl-tRNA reductase, partial [Mizugakiibacter sp.]|nr:glutamyl-tRNA reductase [Mizugakiibacter sp.]
MTLIAYGLNYLTAPVALREKVAFNPDELKQALYSLADAPGVEEALILSTCNRTELYCRVAPEAELIPAEWLHEHHCLKRGKLNEFLVSYRGLDAVRHLFRVATGLESMVIGEPQILGQIKEAYRIAKAVGSLKTPMDRLLQNTFAVAKRVRTDTRIGANPVSVAYTAVRLAERMFIKLEQANVLLVGAGET